VPIMVMTAVNKMGLTQEPVEKPRLFNWRSSSGDVVWVGGKVNSFRVRPPAPASGHGWCVWHRCELNAIENWNRQPPGRTLGDVSKPQATCFFTPGPT
jgi:hypothetical protein